MKTIPLHILTPERTLFEGDIKQVVIPTQSGIITVLADHLPLISLLKAGEIIIDDGKTEIPLVISSGFLQIRKESIKILADTAEKIEEIDEQRALEAQQRAEDALKNSQKDSTEYAYFAAKLEKELSRIRFARKYKR